VTPTLSVDAFHERVKLLIVVAEATRPAGTVGGVVSARVGTMRGTLRAEKLPAASRARTVIV
jgi:hypothetical protein